MISRWRTSGRRQDEDEGLDVEGLEVERQDEDDYKEKKEGVCVGFCRNVRRGIRDILS